MKTSFALLAVTAIYVLSFVTADQLSGNAAATDSNTPDMVPIGIIRNKINTKNNTVLMSDSNLFLSMSDRVKLAKTIKEMSVVSRDVGTARTMSTDDLSRLFARIATTPGMLTHAQGIISSAKSGDTSALADHLVGLLSAADSAEPSPASPDVSASDAATDST